MTQSIFPEIFKDTISDTDNQYLREAKEAGYHLIGYTCSYVPEALLSVDGLIPVRIFAPGVAGTDLADNYLSSVICSYCRSLLEYMLDNRYEHIDGWVFTASCDHLRRLYDNMVYLIPPAFSHMLDLPHKTNDTALEWYTEAVRQLAKELTLKFGVDTGDNALRKSIACRNEYFKLMQSIGKLRCLEDPPITGAEFHTLLRAGSVIPASKMMNFFHTIRTNLETRDLKQKFRARLMIVGSELDDPSYIHVIENTGGLVVADRYCTGSMPGINEIPEKDIDDPIRTLAAHKLRETSCPRMMEDFDIRVNKILEVVEAYKVDGIVITAMKFCDLWNVESSTLVQTFRDAGIPVLYLEREYHLSGEGQLRTRVQAFMESMGK